MNAAPADALAVLTKAIRRPVMRTSKGRHGGGGGKTDKNEAADQRRQASLNTDVDSLQHSRNEDRAGGRKKP